ncbi:hypothetical protein T4A_4881, partial [Trichinella pseudospiralis]
LTKAVKINFDDIWPFSNEIMGTSEEKSNISWLKQQILSVDVANCRLRALEKEHENLKRKLVEKSSYISRFMQVVETLKQNLQKANDDHLLLLSQLQVYEAKAKADENTITELLEQLKVEKLNSFKYELRLKELSSKIEELNLKNASLIQKKAETEQLLQLAEKDISEKNDLKNKSSLLDEKKICLIWNKIFKRHYDSKPNIPPSQCICRAGEQAVVSQGEKSLMKQMKSVHTQAEDIELERSCRISPEANSLEREITRSLAYVKDKTVTASSSEAPLPKKKHLEVDNDMADSIIEIASELEAELLNDLSTFESNRNEVPKEAKMNNVHNEQSRSLPLSSIKPTDVAHSPLKQCSSVPVNEVICNPVPFLSNPEKVDLSIKGRKLKDAKKILSKISNGHSQSPPAAVTSPSLHLQLSKCAGSSKNSTESAKSLPSISSSSTFILHEAAKKKADECDTSLLYKKIIPAMENHFKMGKLSPMKDIQSKCTRKEAIVKKNVEPLNNLNVDIVMSSLKRIILPPLSPIPELVSKDVRANVSPSAEVESTVAEIPTETHSLKVTIEEKKFNAAPDAQQTVTANQLNHELSADECVKYASDSDSDDSLRLAIHDDDDDDDDGVGGGGEEVSAKTKVVDECQSKKIANLAKQSCNQNGNPDVVKGEMWKNSKQSTCVKVCCKPVQVCKPLLNNSVENFQAFEDALSDFAMEKYISNHKTEFNVAKELMDLFPSISSDVIVESVVNVILLQPVDLVPGLWNLKNFKDPPLAPLTLKKDFNVIKLLDAIMSCRPELKNNFFNSLLRELRLRIYSARNGHSCSSMKQALCRFYTLICRFLNETDPIGFLISDIFYCNSSNVLEMMLSVMVTWPVAFRKFVFNESDEMPNFFSIGFNILLHSVAKEKATRLTLHYCDLQELPSVVDAPSYVNQILLEVIWLGSAGRNENGELCLNTACLQKVRQMQFIFAHDKLGDYSTTVYDRLLTPVVNCAQLSDNAEHTDSAQVVIVLLLLIYLFDACMNLPQFDSLVLLKSLRKLLTSNNNLSKDLQSACLQLLLRMAPLYPNDVTRFLKSFENAKEIAFSDDAKMSVVTGERLKILLEARDHCRAER